MPKLGWGTEPIEIIEWVAKEGDWIKQGDVALVISVEKVTSEIEANASGYLHILVEAGNKAPIGSVVGLIAQTKEELNNSKRKTAEGNFNYSQD